jgi:hypothetical protein
VTACAVLLLPALSAAQVPPPVTTPPPAAQAAAPVPAVPAVPADYTFASGAGLVFFYVQRAKAADFEAVLVRIKEALTNVETPMRKQQALNWNIYKSAEPATDAVVFVFAMDPAITTANYDPLLLLAEVLPAEVQPLYTRMKDAIIKFARMGLVKIR